MPWRCPYLTCSTHHSLQWRTDHIPWICTSVNWGKSLLLLWLLTCLEAHAQKWGWGALEDASATPAVPRHRICSHSRTVDPGKCRACKSLSLSHANPPSIWVCSQAYWSDSSRSDVDCVSRGYKASKKTSILQGNRDGTRNPQVTGPSTKSKHLQYLLSPLLC